MQYPIVVYKLIADGDTNQECNFAALICENPYKLYETIKLTLGSAVRAKVANYFVHYTNKGEYVVRRDNITIGGMYGITVNSTGDVPKEPKKKEPDVRSHNVGASNYAKYKIQVWDIWKEYNLNPWDADIVKRVLRTKATDGRRLDYEKIIHICQERIRQIDNEKI